MTGEFTEYATKLVKTWLENTETYYKYMQELAAQALQEADEETSAAEILAEDVERVLQEGSPLDVGLYGDLLDAALREVDYIDVAETILDE